MLSPPDIAVLFGIALLVFGPKRLPELGKSLGTGLGNFKKGLQDAQEEVQNAMKNPPPAAPQEGATLVPPPPVVSQQASGSSDQPSPPPQG